MASDEVHMEMASEAAAAASLEAADAIALAAEKNHDPEVAAVLDDAALAADKTVARVGWLRSVVERLFARRPRSA